MVEEFKKSVAPPDPVQEIGQRLRTVRGAMSQAEFSEEIGVHKNTYGGYERGDRTPDAVLIANVCALYGVRPQWLLWGQGDMRGDELCEEAAPYNDRPTALPTADDSFLMVPKVKARLSAGGGSLETNDEVVGLFAFRAEWLRAKGNPAQMVLMEVAGDSLEPELRDGDTVLVNQGQRDVLAGKLYAVGIGDLVVVKQVETIPGKLVLRSINPSHAPVEVDLRGDLAEEVRIIGRVIWWCREAR